MVLLEKFLSNGKQLVSALQTAGRVDFFSLAVIAALGGVLVPFIAQNYGAGKFDRIKHAIKLSRRFALVWGIVTTVLFISIRNEIGPVFMKGNPDQIFFNFMSELYWIVPYSFVFRMFFVLDTSLLNAFQKTIHTGVLTFFQMILLYIPLSIILGNEFGYKGIYISYLSSTVIGGIASFFVAEKVFKTLNEKQKS